MCELQGWSNVPIHHERLYVFTFIPAKTFYRMYERPLQTRTQTTRLVKTLLAEDGDFHLPWWYICENTLYINYSVEQKQNYS